MHRRECLIDQFINETRNYRCNYLEFLIKKYVRTEDGLEEYDIRTWKVVKNKGSSRGKKAAKGKKIQIKPFGYTSQYNCKSGRKTLNTLKNIVIEEQESFTRNFVDENTSALEIESFISGKKIEWPSYGEAYQSPFSAKENESSELEYASSKAESDVEENSLQSSKYQQSSSSSEDDDQCSISSHAQDKCMSSNKVYRSNVCVKKSSSNKNCQQLLRRRKKFFIKDKVNLSSTTDEKHSLTRKNKLFSEFPDIKDCNVRLERLNIKSYDTKIIQSSAEKSKIPTEKEKKSVSADIEQISRIQNSKCDGTKLMKFGLNSTYRKNVQSSAKKYFLEETESKISTEKQKKTLLKSIEQISKSDVTKCDGIKFMKNSIYNKNAPFISKSCISKEIIKCVPEINSLMLSDKVTKSLAKSCSTLSFNFNFRNKRHEKHSSLHQTFKNKPYSIHEHKSNVHLPKIIHEEQIIQINAVLSPLKKYEKLCSTNSTFSNCKIKPLSCAPLVSRKPLKFTFSSIGIGTSPTTDDQEMKKSYTQNSTTTSLGLKSK